MKRPKTECPMHISIQDVKKEFDTRNGKITALEKTSLEIGSGEFVCLVGPSGCGKTTLLNLVAGLEQPTQGIIYKNGEIITSPGSDRVVIFQESALFPWLNVIKNVEFGLVSRVEAKKRHEIARAFLNLVHLGRFEKSYIHELSGGMKSRVAIARALALNPSVLLMDEPFAALDAQTRDILHDEIQEIWSKTKQTIIFVTHNVREAVCLGNRVLVFSARPGRIKKEFKIELARPRDINSESVMVYVQQIQNELREEIEKFLREEVDRGWTLKKTDFLRPAGVDFGSDI